MSSTYKLQKTSRLYVRTGLQVIRTSLEWLQTSLEVIQTRREVTRTSLLPGGQSLGREQESGRLGEISNLFDFLPTLPERPRNYNRP